MVQLGTSVLLGRLLDGGHSDRGLTPATHVCELALAPGLRSARQCEFG